MAKDAANNFKEELDNSWLSDVPDGEAFVKVGEDSASQLPQQSVEDPSVEMEWFQNYAAPVWKRWQHWDIIMQIGN